MRFKSFDGMDDPEHLLQAAPGDAATQGAGARLGAWRPRRPDAPAYSAAIQYLVNHGYVVLGINNRGSSGYGKSFFTADDHKHGHEPLWDCVEAKKYLQGLPYVDPNRIGIIGGSYGGYMVLAALAFQPRGVRRRRRHLRRRRTGCARSRASRRGGSRERQALYTGDRRSRDGQRLL